jgi:hypothetical protein
MKCPHCLQSLYAQYTRLNVGDDAYAEWYIKWLICPACHKTIIWLFSSRADSSPSRDAARFPITTERLIEPKSISRAPLPKEVPELFACDYKEACLTLADSPKASAALGRRCLQNILREKAGVKKSDLSKEIDQVLASKQLPSHLADSIDAIRNIGNFAAHPIKSTNTGEIVDVEAGEAEWTLDVLEGLFDFYFVQPALLAKKKDALNKKLLEAGKPPMK